MANPTVPSLDGKNPIIPNLVKSLRNYRGLKSETSLKPVQYAQKRELVLKDFLGALAEQYGRVVKPSWIDTNGEMNFNVDTAKGPEDYGPELAELISRVPRRTGVSPTDFPSQPTANWCRINHFDVEKLVEHVQKDIQQIPNPKASADVESTLNP